MFVKDGHGGVSSLLLMVDFEGRPSLALNESVDFGEAQSTGSPGTLSFFGGPVGVL